MRNVIIIDDSLVVRKIVEVALRRVGITCVSYQDGIEALLALKAQEQLPDLIFLDINLPRIDGFDVLRLFKTSPQFDRTPIFVISARDGVLDRLKCRLAGARGYITKPFTVQKLLEAVDRRQV
ncbi:MAG TPA: response regulator [Ktedonobacteraceae bacterium]|jgi:CheY-like chemotaxis protein|nr:response regulator [Ktedonobacteraceae bacterium]